MSTQQAINAHLIEWDSIIRQYRHELEVAAAAEVDHKSARAKFIVNARARGERVSAAQAEVEAEADDHIRDLHLKRLGTQALAESTRQKLVQMRAKADALRSAHVDERAANQLYADRGAGA